MEPSNSKKVTIILSEIDKALAFEWIGSRLSRNKYDLHFILLNNSNSQLEAFLRSNSISFKRIALGRKWQLVFTFLKLWWHLLLTRSDIVHTHLRFASILGITAAYLSGTKKRIHTRHSATFNQVYHPHAVKWDILVSRLSTDIVSISDVVTDVLVKQEGVNPKKITKIDHGFDLKYFYSVHDSRISDLRSKYIPNVKGPIIGAISRYLELKGISYIIEAFKVVLDQYPDAHLLLANASGPDAKKVKMRLNDLPPNSFTEIAFESDVAALYRLFDVFIHVPVAYNLEAFGQTYVESLASGVPSIFTISGIANEFIIEDHNAVVVDYKNSDQIANGIRKILGNLTFRNSIVENGRKSILQFDLPPFIAKLEALYES